MRDVPPSLAQVGITPDILRAFLKLQALPEFDRYGYAGATTAEKRAYTRRLNTVLGMLSKDHETQKRQWFALNEAFRSGAISIMKNPRPRKYASAAERQAAYRARFANVNVRMAQDTAETLERISAETLVPVTELARQMILFALANRNWYTDPRFVRPLTAQAADDRRRATKFQPAADDGDEIED